jgi:uncharacterized protein (TIGR03437 family)
MNERLTRLLAAVISIAGWIAMPGHAQTLPPPTIDNITPSSLTANSPGFTLVVTGTRYRQDSRVVWRFGSLGAVTLNTVFVSQTRLDAQVPPSLLTDPGNITIAVTQPGEATTLVSNTVTFVIFPGLSVLGSCPLPNAIVGQPYSAAFSPTGGTPPYVWTLATGGLPPGLGLSPQGVVSGTATAAVRTNFTVRVTDAQSNSATLDCSVASVTGAPGQSLFITALSPSGVLAGGGDLQVIIRGTAFNTATTAMWNFGRPGTVDLATTFNDPTQLTVTVPAALLRNPGSYPIAVRQQVLTAQVISNSEEFVVAAPVQITNPCPLRDATLNNLYSETLLASGGFPPYTFSLASDPPPGLSVQRSGTLSGTPNEAGVFRFTISVADSRGSSSARECSLRVLGTLTVAPSSGLTFFLEASGTAPPPQAISVATSSADVPVSVQVSTDTAPVWLRVVSGADRAPALLRIGVEAGSLTPGAYRGQVTVTAEGTSNRIAAVPVMLLVAAARTPRIVAQPSGLRFLAPREGSRIPAQPLVLTNPHINARDFAASAATLDGSPWLAISPAQGTVSANNPVILRVRANAAALGAGTYRGSVSVASPGADTIVVPVTLTVTLAPELLVIPQSGIIVNAVTGGPMPSPRRIDVVTEGPNGFFWEAATVGGNWLTVDPASNASRPGESGSTEVFLDPANLAAGVAYADVRVSTAAADNAPRMVSIAAQVRTATASPPAEISTSALVFRDAAPGMQTVTIRNISRASITVDVQFSGDSRVFTVTPEPTRTILPGQSRRVQVAVTKPAGGGVFRGSLAVRSSDDAVVRVVDLVYPSPPAIVQCVPSSLVVASTGLAAGFTVTHGLPAPLEVRVLDNCGTPLTSGMAWAAFPGWPSWPVSLVHTAEGRWVGTWPVEAPSAAPGPAALMITAENADRSAQGFTLLPGVVQTIPGIPVLSAQGLMSAASLQPNAPLSPGGFLSLFGFSLAIGRNVASSVPLPLSLGQTRVRLGERDVPLFFAGDQVTFTQVNGVIPAELAPNNTYQLAVTRDGNRSHYVDVAIAAAAPGVFTVSQTGTGQAVAVDGASQVMLVDANNPALRGNVIVIYCEGLGAVDQQVPAGSASPTPPARVVRAVTVTVGGVPAMVQFAGLTPGSVALYQINVVVPERAPVGPAVPLIVSVADQPSRAATIAVR